MKKIYTSVFALLLAGSAFAQFFQATEYRGAFGTGQNSDWTAGWTNWDPQNNNYGAPTKTVDQDITASTTWQTGDIVLLKGIIYVTNNATLTIEPGVIVRGDKNTQRSSLIITKGAKIMAQGTKDNPIVFTSSENIGSRSEGDWGGIAILGNAKNNQGTAVLEGGLDETKASYGGSDDMDNSGILQYVRIEFGGYPFDTDKEINGLTLGSVGSGTIIDHIQCSYINDDSFEWFGGTVNCKYLISFACVDDDFDTDFGYSGNVQFGLIVRHPDYADQSSGSTSEGFESDNDGSGSTATPKTTAIFSNITSIGPLRGDKAAVVDTKFKRALRIRRNSAISVFNSIFMDWPTGLVIDGGASEANADASELVFKNNILAGMPTNTSVTGMSTWDIAKFFTDNNNISYTESSEVMLEKSYPADFKNPDFRPKAGSPVLTGADFTHAKFSGIVGIKEQEIINGISIHPNPAVDNTSLEILLTTKENVNVQVLDITGKLVKQIINQSLTAGKHLITINTAELQTGTYFAKVSTSNANKTLKLVVVK